MRRRVAGMRRGAERMPQPPAVRAAAGARRRTAGSRASTARSGASGCSSRSPWRSSQSHRAGAVGDRRDGDDAGLAVAGHQAIEHEAGQGEVAEVVGAELKLEAVGGLLAGRRHDAGVVDQAVERTRPTPRRRSRSRGRSPGRRGRAAPSCRLGAAAALAHVFERAPCRAPGRGSPGSTLAPARASSRAVTRPMPEFAPVTTHVRPVCDGMSSCAPAAHSNRKRIHLEEPGEVVDVLVQVGHLDHVFRAQLLREPLDVLPVALGERAVVLVVRGDPRRQLIAERGAQIVRRGVSERAAGAVHLVDDRAAEWQVLLVQLARGSTPPRRSSPTAARR